MSDLRVTNLRGRTSGSSPNLPDGVVVGAAATFTGNVTIGGTITYDDVTRIDSVGIVPAGGGLFVGRNEGTGTGIGATFTTAGDAILAGVVTATSFAGDGGDLTGLNIPAGFTELDAALFN